MENEEDKHGCSMLPGQLTDRLCTARLTLVALGRRCQMSFSRKGTRNDQGHTSRVLTCKRTMPCLLSCRGAGVDGTKNAIQRSTTLSILCNRLRTCALEGSWGGRTPLAERAATSIANSYVLNTRSTGSLQITPLLLQLLL